MFEGPCSHESEEWQSLTMLVDLVSKQNCDWKVKFNS
jgi:hypothetical protein